MPGHAVLLLLVVASVSVGGLVAALLLIAVLSALGVWLGLRVARCMRRPGEPEVSIREKLRRSRAQLREQLTPRERMFFYGYTLVSTLLAPVAIGLLVFGSGSTRGVGIGLLLVALVVMAVPISPFMRARVRRRERRASDRK